MGSKGHFMADYDAIVVGAGLAGSTAAYCMAKAGLSVLILERGDTAGSKNVTGGRLSMVRTGWNWRLIACDDTKIPVRGLPLAGISCFWESEIFDDQSHKQNTD